MRFPIGKMHYAFAFFLAILTANALIAQELLKQHVDNPGQTAMKDTAATGHVPGVLPQTMNAIPGPVGLAVVTGNGINYHGGPVLKSNPVPYLPDFLRQLERHRIQHGSHG